MQQLWWRVHVLTVPPVQGNVADHSSQTLKEATAIVTTGVTTETTAVGVPPRKMTCARISSRSMHVLAQMLCQHTTVLAQACFDVFWLLCMNSFQADHTTAIAALYTFQARH